jgi:hypothetical protein
LFFALKTGAQGRGLLQLRFLTTPRGQLLSFGFFFEAGMSTFLSLRNQFEQFMFKSVEGEAGSAVICDSTSPDRSRE